MSVSSQLLEFDSYLWYLEVIYIIAGFRIRNFKSNSSFLVNYLTLTVIVTILGFLISANVAFFEQTSVYITVQHIWCMTAFTMILSRSANRLKQWANILDLLNWFRDIYSRCYEDEYVTIVNNHLKGMNSVLKRAIPWVWCNRFSDVLDPKN